jgi:hypothetical protein
VGPERRPRRRGCRRDTEVSNIRRTSPPPNGGGATLTADQPVGIGWGADLSVGSSRLKRQEARPLLRDDRFAIPQDEGCQAGPLVAPAPKRHIRGVALILRDRREAAIVSKDEGVRAGRATRSSRPLSHLSPSLFGAATRLERGRAACMRESKRRLQHHSATAKCVTTTQQRVDEMHMRDSGLQRASRPLSRAPISLRGRRNRASRRASQR